MQAALHPSDALAMLKSEELFTL